MPTRPRRLSRMTLKQKLLRFGAVAGILAVGGAALWWSELPEIYGEIASRDFVRAVAGAGNTDEKIAALQDARNTFYQASAVHWARVSAVTAIVSAIVGVIGILFVLITLAETRRQTRAAIDAQRAWVRIKEFKAAALNFMLNDGKIGAGIGCKVAIENIGQTPATDCNYTLLCWLMPSKKASDASTQRHIAGEIIKKYGSSSRGKVLFPGQILSPGVDFGQNAANTTLLGSGTATTEIFDHDLKPEKSENFALFVSLVVQYRISSGQQCMTFETYSVYNTSTPFNTSSILSAQISNPILMSHIENISYAD